MTAIGNAIQWWSVRWTDQEREEEAVGSWRAQRAILSENTDWERANMNAVINRAVDAQILREAK
jgi:hypothetical protein